MSDSSYMAPTEDPHTAYGPWRKFRADMLAQEDDP
jgi:hypothetical protein